MHNSATRSLFTFSPASMLPFMAVTVLLAAMTSCNDNKIDERRIKYMPDMATSPVLESQEAFVIDQVDADGNVVGQRHIPVMQMPVTGTVSRDFVAYDIAKDDLESANALVNPVAPTAEILTRGRDRYNIFCAVCHGQDGNVANAYVAGKVNGIISINTDNVAGKTDGEIYHIITHGRGRMPNYKAQLLPEDRWAIIHYLRALKAAGDVAEGRADEVVAEQIKALQATEADAFAPIPEPVPEYELNQWPDNKREVVGQ